MSNEGKKYDAGKPMWNLLPLDAVGQIVAVLTFGASKYGSNNWQGVENAIERYFAATMRHLAAWRSGEERDHESGLLHLAHAGCCLVFLLYFALRKPDTAQHEQQDVQTPELTELLRRCGATTDPCATCLDEKQCGGGLRMANGQCIHHRRA